MSFHPSLDFNEQGEELCQAARKGQIAAVTSYLAQGVDVNYQEVKNGFTPLHFAAFENRETVVKILLAHNADVTIRSKEKATILHRLCFMGHEKLNLARLFLNIGTIDINAKNKDARYTALHYACRLGQDEYAKLLVEYGANIHAKDCLFQCPIETAGDHGHEELAIWLNEYERQTMINVYIQEQNLMSCSLQGIDGHDNIKCNEINDHRDLYIINESSSRENVSSFE
jgi:ankyrin repeat protein